MITTCLPSTSIGLWSMSPSCTRFDGGRYSIAWMDAVQLAARDRQVTPLGRTAGQHDRVVRRSQHLHVDRLADTGVGPELGALGLHLREATIDVTLLHLELGDAVPQQAADAIGTLEHDDVVAGAGQLLSGGQAGRTRCR